MALPKSSPPIADVAADTATTAALEEITETLRAARDKGLIVLELSLDSVKADHLVRDRHGVADDDTAALVASLRARGQQTPIEVMDLGDGKYGLISGWRRLTALRHLRDTEGGADQVLALLRKPEQASDAYKAMVEENEIRVGLSYYERARIAAKAVEQEVYASQKEALQSLFSTASRAKRSKIKSFQVIVAALDGALKFPEALGERAGLQLAKDLERDAGLAARLRQALQAADISDSATELACLQDVQNQSLYRPKTASSKAQSNLQVTPVSRTTCAPGIEAEVFSDGSLRLSGANVDDTLRDQLVAWLSQTN
jgi:ParB/RepB/Spo0J family partition protein